MSYIMLPQMAAITGWSLEKCRHFAEQQAGAPRARLHRGALHLSWAVQPLCDKLAARGVDGILPGGWCTRKLVCRLLRDALGTTGYARIMRSKLLRQERGKSPAGTPCTLFSLADLLAVHRNADTFNQ
jgi:hypothetical protein